MLQRWLPSRRNLLRGDIFEVAMNSKHHWCMGVYKTEDHFLAMDFLLNLLWGPREERFCKGCVGKLCSVKGYYVFLANAPTTVTNKTNFVEA